jgi:hypothetical protein
VARSQDSCPQPPFLSVALVNLIRSATLSSLRVSLIVTNFAAHHLSRTHSLPAPKTQCAQLLNWDLPFPYLLNILKPLSSVLQTPQYVSSFYLQLESLRNRSLRTHNKKEQKTNLMQQILYSEANCRSSCQEITHVYQNTMFITVFTKASHWSLSRINPLHNHIFYFESILILYSHVRLGAQRHEIILRLETKSFHCICIA